jgi:hypothetical protein
MICINEFENQIDFDAEKKAVQDAFEKIFPEKSSFEL